MGRLLLKLMAAPVAMLTANACAAAISVSSHIDRRLDFSQYRTFDWGPADARPTGDPRLDRDPFFKDHLEGAVERGLARRGIELTTGGIPDLLIHYHANVSERIDVNRADRLYGYCRVSDCPPDVVSYEAGTLVLDFIDPRTDTLVWRAWAQNDVKDMLRDRDKMAKTIDRAVAEMLLQLPGLR